ncbi:FHA domain-containing serine/threonine-protein kinase [Okeania sp.]|uniref:FHA domain-containing serine/threonine-protein kinase n=1 Tax=Okeania sp. TaxID=3100323 RepID=UPI002B4B4617|nr:FHA domain-containing serine/threonine-protein kinase [Okeania sp.]MEB3341036.1 FHA domain-containing serine/threonine-protein kinase [Okeania sp.]
MIRLTLLDPQKNTPIKKWDFQRESIIKVGRSPDNHIVLSDTLVSRYHLELHRVSKSVNLWRIISQGTNGTFVNGILMSQGIVSDGSLIQLARSGPIIKFQVQTPTAPQNPKKCCPRAEDNPPGNLFCIYCGQPIRVERSIRQYQVLRTLGQGGMGTTYLAWDRKQHNLQGIDASPTASLVVLKEMNADMAQIMKAQELFEREAKALKSLNHPGIPKFFDFFVEEDKKYLAMEMIHGQDLEKRIVTQGPILPQQGIEWMIQTCEILEYIHSQEPPLIHRDIKPANLLIRRRDNQIVVLDFGAVKEIGTPLGTRIGAEGYSAPEQDRGQPLTQSDLYAVGATLIFVLTSQSPMKFYDNRGDGYRFHIESVPTITPQLREVIEKVTQPLPSDRYQTAPELAEALKNCL